MHIVWMCSCMVKFRLKKCQLTIFLIMGIYYSCSWVKFWQDWQLSPDKHQELPHLEGTSQMETWLINAGKLAMSHLVRGGDHTSTYQAEKIGERGKSNNSCLFRVCSTGSCQLKKKYRCLRKWHLHWLFVFLSLRLCVSPSQRYQRVFGVTMNQCKRNGPFDF